MDATGFQLDRLLPASDDYPMRPIEQAITWADAASVEAAAEWYLVVFRSIRRFDVDESELVRHDDAAHAEAMSAPGFVHYFKGPLSVERACLSFCLWTSREAARVASGMPAHRAAVAFIGDAYDHFTLEFYRARKVAGSLAWTFEPYDRAPAGSDEVAKAA
jgi:hypothetical protein